MATRRKGLGRGLDALLGAGTHQQESASVQDAIEQVQSPTADVNGQLKYNTAW
jgi:hypothetical protein